MDNPADPGCGKEVDCAVFLREWKRYLVTIHDVERALEGVHHEFCDLVGTLTKRYAVRPEYPPST